MGDRLRLAVAPALSVAVLSWLLVYVIRRYAVASGLIDNPRERGSHTVPTPRGGGAGLVGAAILGYLVFSPVGLTDWRTVLVFISVVPTAVVGWLDDRGGLPVLPRFAAHLASGLLILPFAVDSALPVGIQFVLGAIWLFATVSAINVVNFMDGIDGLIGLQALVFAIHLVLLSSWGTSAWTFGLVLAAATTGFLYWNWSPASVFLGDVGSGSLAVLGVVGGVLVWRASTERFWPFVTVFLPLFPIFLDATVAIVRRARKREPLTVAHRTHLYQRLANEGNWGHARVSLLYGAAATTAGVVIAVVPSQLLPSGCLAYVVAITALGFRLDRVMPSHRSRRAPQSS